MKTVADAFLFFVESLKGVYDKDEVNSLKYVVISELTQLSKTQLRAFADQVLPTKQYLSITHAVSELQGGKPVQYILGHTDFYGLPFKVDASVLIPRPETEELVEWVLGKNQELRIKNQEIGKRGAESREQISTIDSQRANVEMSQINGLRTIRILDIGTGSGCIAISLKKHLPDAEVSGMDISTSALAIARLNAELNNVAVNFFEADILDIDTISNFNLTADGKKFSIIVSNPPYVTEKEKAEMHNNVLNYEPHSALFVPDNDPLIFYDAIAEFALQHLQPTGLLFFEINENLGRQTVELIENKGFINIELRHDMRGKDRMIKAQNPV